MWRSLSIPCFRSKKNLADLARASHDSSDDETSSNASAEEALECPICWESFNIVENIPYVLWCGHTLCKNCILGLQRPTLKLSFQHVQVPFFVSCPWCNLLTFRLIYKGNLRLPSKNFFLLWMVESRNGDRMQSAPPYTRDRHQICSPRCTSVLGNSSCNNTTNRRLLQVNHSSSGRSRNRPIDIASERIQISFHKSLDYFIHLTTKLPFVVLLLIVLFAIPISAVILVLYLIMTIFIALPAFLVLYFAYPTLDWVGREIRT
ncbi:uncharacterized protein LOC127261905 [Andrographis paniculata]|uniref:uncharacterized protein LOC127261905 n=1 Tax=Andrographis paniculata TaxID=175694 RepID=UPI0021E7C9BC|nr:uncharacterized protein LOC127261905 [Andrographis paniculata]XP_051146294.1 uncharacterized protein LOC127261905 [Andrographis paniculata]XP_051146295.1 uncharacterized protein LOC127261905 [Andrographis paniculata]XP_051146296.1 uncharacterized protein LOC127261905 [Andrographis paniculata]